MFSYCMKMGEKVCSKTNSDRISALPEPLKHHILSYLMTKTAIRTCILSSSWRAVWTGLTCFKLDGSFIDCSLVPADLLVCNSSGDDAFIARKDSVIRKTKMFSDFVYQVFRSITKLEELELCVPGYNFELQLESQLDDWLNCVVGLNVNKLNLDVKGSRYRLPKSVLSCKSITELRLSKCEINLASLTDTQLPSLREIWLGGVYLNEAVLEGLLANCMNLQRFTLMGCRGLKRLKVSGLARLERVAVDVLVHKNALEAVEINAPNLLGFSYEYEGGNVGDESCDIDVSRCRNMNCLELGGVSFDDGALSAFLEHLPLLETLTIRNCNYLRKVEILRQKLVSLTFVDCRMLTKVKVDTTILQDFSFFGQHPITFVPKHSSLKLRQAFISLELTLRTEKCYSELVKFLAKLGQTGKLSLDFGVVQDFLIPENVRMKSCNPLIGVKQLQVEVRMQPFKDKAAEFIESLLWLAPCPQSISISYPVEFYQSYNMTCRKLLKFKYGRPLKRKRNCGCWKSFPMHCLQHSLREVLLETLEQNVSNTIYPCISGLLEDHNKEVDTNLAKFFQQPRFGGKWLLLSKVSKPKVCWRGLSLLSFIA